LRYKNAFEFEIWTVRQFGGTSNTKQRHDFGLDGRMPDNTPIQAKRSENIGRNVKAGVHTIAVKVVDNEGLESLEIVKLKVNGVVKKM